MLDALRPRHVGDVNQAVYARLDLDERAERREVAHLSLEARADGVLLRQRHPGILLGLLHAEGDLLLRLVHLEHHGFDRLPDGNDLRRMPDIAGPAHLGDADEPLDPRFEMSWTRNVRHPSK